MTKLCFQIIEMVAEDSEEKGMFEDSVKLYDLAGNHEKVVELLCKLLAQVSEQQLTLNKKKPQN